ncbi:MULTISPECIES: fumarylacetoacetate hydrolase family protein [unclassified Apibacter]|uniref:fumarylacetoacetate hydrolase family protein n=1 Tax=unclassified Apibacter TaxID=2630820 RepID=UPI001321174E|nr:MULTISPECIES: fumarylacetoacetate hydrolase family protein [unclassified Apibacter]MCX8677355.1 fumarylacetoacetate hydrolase family protein [Apibacter sp. B3919]MXO25515.1 2-hydroxyhepta-2,4-diene-1,7-dioate isomerase [Apibacter sp. B3924]MXO26830.1 2-hydroxyhepta-2,4-diene-1,7-dioate isomerase [Apibacter sp. B3813]MXO28600.1 2-hydroxyhepta-2,4-diene-1,7-dioate isomerase [Apibacter sp. B3913]MXO30554.1 2-hydroxyhepta-2,4-diene-1,7-dioate isomerase [Apibacter sp. B3912]
MKFICVGRNYSNHAKELNNEIPKDPVLFIKPDTALARPGDDWYIPEFTENLQHEVEVLIKISKVGKYIQPEFAGNYYSEIGLGIDFTARDLQDRLKEKGLPWEKSKAFDRSALIGNFVSKDKFNLDNLNFSLVKNGNIQQKGNTSEMIFSFDYLVSYISQYFTLKMGDIIFTGTPSGVSKLSENDFLEGFIENEKFFEVKIR